MGDTSGSGHGPVRWGPIELPSTSELAYESSATKQLGSLKSAWVQAKTQLEATRADAAREFLNRLVRSWAIETGILERLYDLDEGATKTLIEHGFRADLVNRSESSLAPEDLVALLNDHVAAAGMVQDLIGAARPFSPHFIRELHALLTRRQTWTRAVTPMGDDLEVELRHGEWKSLPNNPQRTDGTAHEYTPPEHVAAEMDRLTEGMQLLDGERAAITAAWMHHRFTAIHPFQDGNGRVARALTNYVYIKDGLFPLVIHRTQRIRYLEALEQADRNDLGPLIDLFAEIQSDTVLKALSFSSEEREGASVVQDVVDRLAQKIGSRVRDRESALRTVNVVARALRDRGRDHLVRVATESADRLEAAGLKLRVYSGLGGPDFDNGHFWRFQVIQVANELEYWVNLEEDHYWFRIALEGAAVRLQLVISFHHVGRDVSGVARAIAFAELETERPDKADGEGASSGKERMMRNCTPTVFGITWQEDADAAWSSFESWLGEAFAVALRYWEDTL